MSTTADGATNTVGKLTLYTAPSSSGTIVYWYLKELAVDADIKNFDLQEKLHKQDAYLQISPFGTVPAIVDGDLKLFETGACLLYLAEKYGSPLTAEQRARAAAWTHFANSDLSNVVWEPSIRERRMAEMFGHLERVLGKQEYLVDNTFSAADAAVCGHLLCLPGFFPDVDLSAWPNLRRYIKRVALRPASMETCIPSLPPGAVERISGLAD